MFRHQVTLRLKTRSSRRFSKKIENQLLPTSCELEGFRAGNLSVVRQQPRFTEDTLSTSADLEVYRELAFLKVMDRLSDVLTIAPDAVNSEVSGSGREGV